MVSLVDDDVILTCLAKTGVTKSDLLHVPGDFSLEALAKATKHEVHRAKVHDVLGAIEDDGIMANSVSNRAKLMALQLSQGGRDLVSGQVQNVHKVFQELMMSS